MGTFGRIEATTAAATCTGTIWYQWCEVDTTDTSSNGWIHCTPSTSVVWYSWTTSSSATTATMSASGTAPSSMSAVELTPEEREQRAAAAAQYQAEYQRQQKKVAEQKKAADERATELLLEHLNGEQRQEFREHKRFRVTARSGTVYRLKLGWAGNVEALGDDGATVLRRYCIHPDVSIPYADNLLCQKLLIETNEEMFLRVANMTVIRRESPARATTEAA